MSTLLATPAVLPLADTWGMHNAGTGGWFLMMVAMVLFWGLIIFGVMRLFQGRSTTPGGQAIETPDEILNRRLADGTLSPEEFKEHRRLLNKAGNGGD